MITTIAILVCLYCSFYVHVFLHEREHAKACLSHGFRPHYVALGAPIPFLWKLYLEVRSPRVLDGIPIRIYPFLVGGAAKIDLVQLRCLLRCKFSLQADILSAGIWANFFYSSLGFAAWLLFRHEWFYGLLCDLVSAGLWFGKRLLSVYVLPLSTLLVGGYMLPKMLSDMFFRQPNAKATIVHGVSSSMQSGLSWDQGLFIFLFSGLILGMLNLLPLLPFDGGRLVHAFLKTRWVKLSRLYAYATMPVCALILGYSAFLEAYALFK